jgi:FMN-dependent NADH-azoreductase
MSKILHIDSSAKPQGSVTRALSAEAVAVLQKQNPGSSVVYRDLTKDPLPHISPEYLGGIFAPGQTPEHETVKLSDKLIEEILAADVIVIGAPMYNFTLPSQLKAWLDYVVRAGKTFRYGAAGPEGLVQGKRVILAVASGGVYKEGPMASYDHVVTYMKQILGFLGIHDVSVAWAEKQAMGPDVAGPELERAKHEIALLQPA